jgi:hypothetical protein
VLQGGGLPRVKPRGKPRGKPPWKEKPRGKERGKRASAARFAKEAPQRASQWPRKPRERLDRSERRPRIPSTSGPRSARGASQDGCAPSRRHPSHDPMRLRGTLALLVAALLVLERPRDSQGKASKLSGSSLPFSPRAHPHTRPSLLRLALRILVRDSDVSRVEGLAFDSRFLRLGIDALPALALPPPPTQPRPVDHHSLLLSLSPTRLKGQRHSYQVLITSSADLYAQY